MLQLKYELKDQVTHIHLIGPIDDQAAKPLNDLLSHVSKQVIINFAAVEYFNSLGIRTWVNFLRILIDGRKVSYEDCPMDFIQQLNMIPALSKGVDIHSFTAEFSCNECGHEQKILFSCNIGRTALLNQMDQQLCERCSSQLQLEEDPRTLLFFMKD